METLTPPDVADILTLLVENGEAEEHVCQIVDSCTREAAYKGLVSCGCKTTACIPHHDVYKATETRLLQFLTCIHPGTGHEGKRVTITWVPLRSG